MFSNSFRRCKRRGCGSAGSGWRSEAIVRRGTVIIQTRFWSLWRHCEAMCVSVTQRHPRGAAEVDARTLVSHNKRQTDVCVSQLTQASDFPCFPCIELLPRRVVWCTLTIHILLLQIHVGLNRLRSWLSNHSPWPVFCTCAPASQVPIFVGRACVMQKCRYTYTHKDTKLEMDIDTYIDKNR